LDLVHNDESSAIFVEDSFLEDHFPVGFSPSTTDAVSFFIRGTEHWIDFSQSYFQASGEIIGSSTTKVAATGEDLKAGSTDPEFFIEQNFWHSIFASIDVTINDVSVTYNNSNYPYIAYFNNLFNLSSDQTKTIGALSLWTETDAARKNSIISGNKLSGIFQLKIPLFMRMKNLYSFLNTNIKLNRVSNPAFYFRWGASPSGYSFKLTNIILKARKIKVTDSWNQFYESFLASDQLIRYIYKDFRVLTKTYAGYGNEIIEDNLFHGEKPSRLIFGFVENDAFTGAKTKKPFSFINMSSKIKEVGVLVNGQLFPHPMIKTDFETKDTFEAYHLLMASVQAISSPDPPIITKTDFDSGVSTLFSFNLSPDQFSSVDQKTFFNQPASVRIHVKFSAGDSTKAVTLVVYYEMQTEMAFNKTRQVIYRAR
jgi:hypothetical protein